MAKFSNKLKVTVVAAGLIIGLVALVLPLVKPKTHAIVPASTYCFTVSMPINYKLSIPNHGASCSLSGQLLSGEGILIAPQKFTSLDDGISKFQKSRPGLKGTKLTLGGLPAYQIDGTTKYQNGTKFTTRIYLVYSSKEYKRRITPPDSVNGFFISINTKSTNAKLLDQIATSIRWR